MNSVRSTLFIEEFKKRNSSAGATCASQPAPMEQICSFISFLYTGNPVGVSQSVSNDIDLLYYHLLNMPYRFNLCICIFLLTAYTVTSQSKVAATSYKDTSFWQEYHEPYPVGKTAAENEVRGITSDNMLNIWIATAAGIFTKKENEKKWEAIDLREDNGPAYAIITDSRNAIWAGTWKGVYMFQFNEIKKISGTEGPISVLCNSTEGIYALGPQGIWLYNGKAFEKKNYTIAKSVRSAVSDNNGGLWIATDVGLYHCINNSTSYLQKTDVLISAYIKSIAFNTTQNMWVGGLGGVSILRDKKRIQTLTSQNGIPSVHVNCIQKSPDGRMWVGTNTGIVRYNAKQQHSLIFSRRWLLDDKVTAIHFDVEGTAWVATPAGVSAIKKQKMNLAQKQDFFYDVTMKRHVREPWIVGQCKLKDVNNINTWEPDDDDNDGEYGGNYLAMESFRYAVTKSEDAKSKAKKSFEFLKLLREVTGLDGFFARTIVPVSWGNNVHDANETFTDKQLAEELVKEPRFKPVGTRWQKSKDGKWLWKGDTSSDEWCGHMMGYFFYYTLVADDAEKKVVADHVSKLVDHLINHNFNMVDIDGTHTRWSVWSPDDLNHNPEWTPDRFQNSMELLTFLKLAYYMTGDIKYQQHYLRLIKEEHYLNNMSHITEQNPAWFIYFDVVLQMYLYPILLHCEQDAALHTFYEQQADKWMAKRINDKSPIINFFYSYARHKKVGLAASIDFLKDTPLDLVNWSIDHTKREDVKLVRTPVLEEIQLSELPPASIRAAVRWDRNPWLATNGFASIEREPVFWLLPYWMGRYLKMVED